MAYSKKTTYCETQRCIAKEIVIFDNKHTTYPLLPFSELVWEMTRYMPSVYLFSADFIIRGGGLHKEHVEKAMKTAIGVHPVFEMRIDRHGMQYRQPLTNPLHGRYHSVDIVRNGDDLRLRCTMSRVLGDGRSVQIIAEDFARAYLSLPIEEDRYWEYLEAVEQTKQTERYKASRQWLEQRFSDKSVPVRPKTDRRHLWTLLPPRAGLLTLDLTKYKNAILALADEQRLSLDGIFSLAAALAIMEYNDTDSAALTWAYEGRETETEQRIFGSLHRDVPFLIKREKSKNDITREELLRHARQEIRQGIAHSDYPLTLTPPHTDRWNYAVNVLRMQSNPFAAMTTQLPFQIEQLPTQKQKYAYALLDIEYYDEPNTLQLTFRYSATHYKHTSIQRFADLVKEQIEWLIQR